jgi:adenylate cyclase
VPVGLVVAACVGFLAYRATRSARDNSLAPQDPNTPFAIVFTDIQSSTSLWARAPQQMSESVERHHDEIRKLIVEYGGYEVKTIGDSFMVAFKSAMDATRFALSIQTVFYGLPWAAEVDETYRDLAREAFEEALQEASGAGEIKSLSATTPQWADDVNYPLNWHGIRVRVGLHWGVGSVKLDPVSQGYDYYGTVVNTAARVEGVGNGGQVLATKDMFDQLEREQFDFSQVAVTPLGPQPLRGLDAPIPLFQLCPLTLKSRQFNALRLDVEIVHEDESEFSDAGKSVLSAGSHSSVTPEMFAERQIAKLNGTPQTLEMVFRNSKFMDVLFSTSSATWISETTEHLMKKWRINARKVTKSMPKEVKARTQSLNLMELMVRTTMAMNAAVKAEMKMGASSVTSFNLPSPFVGGGGAQNHRLSRRGSHLLFVKSTNSVVMSDQVAAFAAE